MKLPLLCLLAYVAGHLTEAAEFRSGSAAVDITPREAIRLSGYAARQTEAEGVWQRLNVKALAIEQNGGDVALMITIDNCGISKLIRDEIVERIGSASGIPPERIVIFSSHTHSAPALSGYLGNLFIQLIPEGEQETLRHYTRELVEKTVQAANSALADLRPAEIFFGQGRATFAKNRRTEGGPVDHDTPVLVIRDADGTLRSVLANYACHCTTLQGNHNFVHGDWAGVAQAAIERENPGATAMISIGCGADSNPFPRGELTNAVAHGEELAREVQGLIDAPLVELVEAIEFRTEAFELPFDPLPTVEEWQTRAAQGGIVGYHARRNLARLSGGAMLPTSLPYLVQTWNFGSELAMVFLPGEVVVDYALRLKSELDRERLWVSGYANWVPCYIPSTRILNEGGYEAESSLWYYDQPARLSTKTEELIISSVHRLLDEKFKADPVSKENTKRIENQPSNETAPAGT